MYTGSKPHLPPENKDRDDALPASTACGATNTADVLRGIAREVEQYDMLHIGRVDATRGTVCTD